MKRLNVSDIHIGLEPDGRMHRVLDFCAKEGPDEVVFHGDTFHLNELGEDACYTLDNKLLYELFITYHIKIIPGNHDWNLREFTPSLPIVEPFIDEVGYYHSHWNEFDSLMQWPHWWHLIIGRIFGRKKTPLILKEQDSEAFAIYCGAIEANALQWAYHNIESKTLIGGHSHRPMEAHYHDSGVNLWNTGDLVDSFSGILQEGKELRVVRL